MRATIVLIAFLFFLSLFAFPSFAANLLLNPGFEDGLSSWTLNGSTATFSAISDPKHGGNSSAKLSKENASSWAYFYQRIPIEVSKYYKLSGWLRLNDDFITNGKLRFYWLSDSNGTKISSDPVEVTLTSKNSDFQFIETDSIVSPDQSAFAEVQGYVYLNQKNPVVPLLFDDITFENNQPTPTPIPPTSTPIPPTATPIPPTPTKILTPTPIPNTPTPTSKPSATPTSKPLPTSILGESTQSALIISPTDVMSKKNVLVSNKSKSPNNNFQKTLIFIGVVFIVSCVILTFREIRKRRLMQDE